MAKTRRKFKATTYSKHKHPVAKNVLNQNFNTKKSNQVWVALLLTSLLVKAGYI